MQPKPKVITTYNSKSRLVLDPREENYMVLLLVDAMFFWS